jgi:GT2 family glycosyltransferase
MYNANSAADAGVTDIVETTALAAKSSIGVVILNYRKLDETKRCITSVLNEFDHSAGLRCQLVVVDNNPADSVRDNLEEWIKDMSRADIQLIQTTENIGFSGGMNTGIRRLLENQPDFVWLLNNDLVVGQGSLSLIADYASINKGLRIVGPTVLSIDRDVVQCAGGCKYTPWLGLEVPQMEGLSLEDVLSQHEPDLDYIYGAAMFLRRDFLEQHGLLDESYFLFYEEAELATKVATTELGWCKDAIVFHAGSKSAGVSRQQRAFTAYHAAFSGFKFTRSHYPYYLPSLIFSRIVGLALLGIAKGNWRLVAAPWIALYDFIKKNPPRRKAFS